MKVGQQGWGGSIRVGQGRQSLVFPPPPGGEGEGSCEAEEPPPSKRRRGVLPWARVALQLARNAFPVISNPREREKKRSRERERERKVEGTLAREKEQAERRGVLFERSREGGGSNVDAADARVEEGVCDKKKISIFDFFFFPSVCARSGRLFPFEITKEGRKIVVKSRRRSLSASSLWRTQSLVQHDWQSGIGERERETRPQKKKQVYFFFFFFCIIQGLQGLQFFFLFLSPSEGQAVRKQIYQVCVCMCVCVRKQKSSSSFGVVGLLSFPSQKGKEEKKTPFFFLSFFQKSITSLSP